MFFKNYTQIQLRRLIVATNWAIGAMSDILIGTVLERHRDVVLITGGCSGLGRAIVHEMKFHKMPKVIVFDLHVPSENEKIPGVHYYACDVSDVERIQELAQIIKAEIGVVTVVINNAGIASGKSMLELSFREIEKIIAVNLTSSFYINKTFLPNMILLKRGYIVTVASVLGYMTPARLTAYGASKSGLIAMHESMTYELGPPLGGTSGIKTLLICPGQLRTPLFNGVSTPCSIFAPELEPSFVAGKIFRALECGRRGEIQLPLYGNFLPLFRSLPWPVTQAVRMISGMDEAMSTHKPPMGPLARA